MAHFFAVNIDLKVRETTRVLVGVRLRGARQVLASDEANARAELVGERVNEFRVLACEWIAAAERLGRLVVESELDVFRRMVCSVRHVRGSTPVKGTAEESKYKADIAQHRDKTLGKPGGADCGDMAPPYLQPAGHGQFRAVFFHQQLSSAVHRDTCVQCGVAVQSGSGHYATAHVFSCAFGPNGPQYLVRTCHGCNMRGKTDETPFVLPRGYPVYLISVNHLHTTSARDGVVAWFDGGDGVPIAAAVTAVAAPRSPAAVAVAPRAVAAASPAAAVAVGASTPYTVVFTTRTGKKYHLDRDCYGATTEVGFPGGVPMSMVCSKCLARHRPGV